MKGGRGGFSSVHAETVVRVTQVKLVDHSLLGWYGTQDTLWRAKQSSVSMLFKIMITKWSWKRPKSVLVGWQKVAFDYRLSLYKTSTWSLFRRLNHYKLHFLNHYPEYLTTSTADSFIWSYSLEALTSHRHWNTVTYTFSNSIQITCTFLAFLISWCCASISNHVWYI